MDDGRLLVVRASVEIEGGSRSDRLEAADLLGQTLLRALGTCGVGSSQLRVMAAHDPPQPMPPLRLISD